MDSSELNNLVSIIKSQVLRSLNTPNSALIDVQNDSGGNILVKVDENALTAFIKALIPSLPNGLPDAPDSGGYALVSEDKTVSWTQGIVLGSTSVVNAFLGYGSDSVWKMSLTDGTIASGVTPSYLELDNSKVFLGLGDDSIVKLVINDGDHASGLNNSYLDIDNSKAFFGFDSSDSSYKATLTDNSNGCGLHPAYLNFNSNVYLGYTNSKYQLTITDGTNACGLESNALVFNSLTVADKDGFYAIDSGVYKIGTEVIADKDGFYVGDTKVLDGSIDLGPSGTVVINGVTFQPGQIQDCNGKTLWVLADANGWQ